MTEKEYRSLTSKAHRAGMTKAAFIRNAVENKEVAEAPSVDVPALIWEVRQVAGRLDRILKTVDSRGMPEASELRKALEENRAVEKMIIRAYGC